MFGIRHGGALRREHVAVERVPEPVEQPLGGGVVAQDGGKGAVAVLALQALRRDDPPVDEVPREDRPADQPLGGGAVQPGGDEVPLQGGQIGKQLAIDAGPAIHGGAGLPPEPARLHGQPAGEVVELVQGTFDGTERPEPMGGGVPGRPRSAEAVVQIDPLRGHDPQQRREPQVPDFAAPRRDPIVGGNVRFVLEVDGDGGIAAPQRVGRELPGPAAAARLVAQKHAVRRFAAGEIAGGFQHVLQHGGRHWTRCSTVARYRGPGSGSPRPGDGAACCAAKIVSFVASPICSSSGRRPDRRSLARTRFRKPSPRASM